MGWLAKERASAASRAELDEVAKTRLAQAWMNLYDDRARLREGIEEAIDLLNTPLGAGEALAVLTALVDWTEQGCREGYAHEAGKDGRCIWCNTHIDGEVERD